MSRVEVTFICSRCGAELHAQGRDQKTIRDFAHEEGCRWVGGAFVCMSCTGILNMKVKFERERRRKRRDNDQPPR